MQKKVSLVDHMVLYPLTFRHKRFQASSATKLWVLTFPKDRNQNPKRPQVPFEIHKTQPSQSGSFPDTQMF